MNPVRALILIIVTTSVCAFCAPRGDAAGKRAGTSMMPATRMDLSRDGRVAWLRRHARPLRSIDPADEDFADLQPLKDAIGNARVVMLGEGSHAAGSAILAKARLVRFLHRELGFDVLAIESGLYEVSEAWELLRAGVDPLQALRRGVFAVWTGTAEFLPVVDYLARSARSPRPLELVGFDSQLTGSASTELMIPELRAYFSRRGVTPPALAEGSVFVRAITTRGQAGYTVPDSAFAAAVADLQRAIASSDAAASAETMFWTQVLQSLAGQAESYMALNSAARASDPTGRDVQWLRAWNARDAQMARNVEWLANRRYHGRKLIVWAATAHIAYSGVGADAESGAPSVPMGELLRAMMGADVYSIGITAFEGELGNPRWPGYSQQLRADSSGIVGFEELMHASGHEHAFVDFRHRDEAGAWLDGRLPGRLLRHETIIASWPEVLDGALYLREMRPATPGAR